jgi:hypothetical protein
MRDRVATAPLPLGGADQRRGRRPRVWLIAFAGRRGAGAAVRAAAAIVVAAVVLLALLPPVVLLVVVELLPLAAGLARLARMQIRATQISSSSQISGRAMGQAVRIRASRAGTPSGRSS